MPLTAEELEKAIEPFKAFGQQRFKCTVCKNYDSYKLEEVKEHVRLVHFNGQAPTQR